VVRGESYLTVIVIAAAVVEEPLVDADCARAVARRLSKVADSLAHRS
jgi:hypothetical protein